ncbi:MAG: hypothetical protein U0231_12485 [Nitrospiraceae bacterium]
MTVTRLYLGGDVLIVSGREGYAPVGEIRVNGGPTNGNPYPGLTALLRAGVLCNGAELRLEALAWQVLGDPTEGIIVVSSKDRTLESRFGS